MPPPFVHAVTVRLADVDAAGIIFFARYFEFCHAAYEEALRTGGFPIERFLVEGDVKIPIVHTEADFTAPARLGERLTVRVLYAHRGRTSFTLAYEIAGPDGSACAKCRTVHVAVQRSDFAPTPIPDAIAGALAAALGEPPP